MAVHINPSVAKRTSVAQSVEQPPARRPERLIPSVRRDHGYGVASPQLAPGFQGQLHQAPRSEVLPRHDVRQASPAKTGAQEGMLRAEIGHAPCVQGSDPVFCARNGLLGLPKNDLEVVAQVVVVDRPSSRREGMRGGRNGQQARLHDDMALEDVGKEQVDQNTDVGLASGDADGVTADAHGERLRDKTELHRWERVVKSRTNR